MDLTHRFTVPTPVEETWDHFDDVASVAQCFPGAQVTSVDGDTFTGSAKIKLGPIALVYTGTGTFLERDATAHRMVLDAKGKDKRGNGTAGAKVVVTMAAAAGGATDVEVVTDLAVTGKPAQFGRGVMQDVSDKLLGQFVSCLEQRLAAPTEPEVGPGALEDAVPPAADPDAGPASTPSGAAATVAPAGDQDAGPASAPAAAAPQTAAPSAAAPSAAAPSAAAPPRSRRTLPPPPPQQDEALDLGATVLPVLAKAYWKQGLGALIVLWLLRTLVRRRRAD